jgi:cobaltochelatase CobT
MASKSENPADVFKRALTQATRSLAESADLEVSFSGDGPQLNGHHAVLPHPPRDLTGAEATRIRGLADQMALRLAHHDTAAHARLSPTSPLGRAVYEAVEQARIEAIGANALGGVRANLAAVLEQTVERKGLARHDPAAAPPLADIIGLMVRERLTGDAPPQAARLLVNRHRAEIEDKAGADLDRLVASLDNQAAFARVARAIIKDLDLGDDFRDEPEGREQGEGDPEDGPKDSQDEDTEARDEDGDRGAPDPSRAEDGDTDGDQERMELDADAEPQDGEETRGRRRRAAGPAPGQGSRPARAALQGLHRRLRRGGRGRGPVRRTGADPPARLSGPAIGQSAQCGLAPGQPAATAADGPAEPRLDL